MWQKKDDILVELDDREIKARFEQASAQYARIKGFFEKKAATAEQMESVESAYLQARAALSYTKIRSPIDGAVSGKQVQAGDLAWPGRSLLSVYNPEALRLEASVREGLLSRIKKGGRYRIQLPAVGKTVEGVLAEVVPSANPASRSFDVRVDFDRIEGCPRNVRAPSICGGREACCAGSG